MKQEVKNQMTQLLKNEVQTKFGRSISYAKDCEELAIYIKNETKRPISPSTLKRVFGIIKSSFAPSLFTLDTLSIFLGFTDWQEFMNKFEKEKHHFSTEDNWESLKKRTNEITYKSLESLKNKMGNRYKHLPYRDFAEKRVARFLSAPEVATAFIAPDSYGKTPIIVQLSEKFFTAPNALFPNDILCLVDGTILYNLVTNHKKINRLYNLIEYNPQNSFSTIFRDRPELVKGKFILIIDEIDDIYSSDTKTSQFIDNLLKLIISYENIDWFKILITCTPRTWRMFQERIKKNQLMQKLWYNVPLQGDEQSFINIPLLKTKEIEEAFRERNLPYSVDDLNLNNPDLLDILKNPYLLHLFILLGKTHGDLRDIDLLNLYIKKMVFTPPLLNEKYAVLNAYFNLCSKGERCMEVKKKDLKLSSSAKLAFIELIRIGFFYEYSLIDEYLTLTTYVRFSHHSLYAYYMANILLKDNNLNIDQLREKIQVYNNSTKLQKLLVEYILKILLKEERVELLKDVFKLFEKNKNSELPSIHYNLYWWGVLASILSDEMRKNPSIRKILLPVYAQSEIGKTIFFERFFDFDCLALSSGDELESLANDIQKPQCLYFIHFLKFMHYFLSDDKNQCEQEYRNLKKLPIPEEESPLNTSYFFIPQIIYQSVFEKKVDQEILSKVYLISNKFIKNGIQKRAEIPTFEFGILFALNYGKMSKEIIDLSNYIFDNYELVNLQLLISYQLFLSVYAKALLDSGNEKRAFDVYNQVKFKHLIFPKHMKYYLKIRLMLINAEFLMHQKEHNHAKKILHKIKSISLKLKFKNFYNEANELDTRLPQRQLN